MPVSILLVDDFEPFRQFVIATIKKQPELQVICEASDGLVAIQKARRLQPQLVLLDIGSPTLNGIEAARLILAFAPKSRILFLSQESSRAIVQAAFDSGAWGYVLKSDAGRELLPAINAVLRGERYISSRLAGHGFLDVRAA